MLRTSHSSFAAAPPYVHWKTLALFAVEALCTATALPLWRAVIR